MTIEINDRLYKELAIWARANGMDDEDIAKYIENALREKFTLEKYGDLNDKVRKESGKPTDEPNHEPINEPINKPIPEIGTEEQISERINEQINEQIDEDIKPEKPSRRKTKVLTSK